MCVIRADRQSAGRGRGSNSYFSDTDGGLWVSVVAPIGSLDTHFVYNRAMSMAIADTLSGLVPDVRVAIKWPNDIYWNDRKICGMLLETITAATTHIVIGFGLNVNIAREQFPPDVRTIATSVFAETGWKFDLDKVLCGILRDFEENRKASPAILHELYRKRLYRVGAAIEIDGKEGIFADVDEQGRLVMNTAQGAEYVMSGSMRLV
jgi:BirA family biotin operon repressor/biotin-[acetyl-CoA-carboxylase] ligase